MVRLRQLAGPAFLAALGVLATWPVQAQTAPPHKAASSSVVPGKSASASKSRHKKPDPVPEVPQAPPTPPTLEQQPPTPAQVTYSDGLLTISATNATLSQVLQSVGSQTGASVDIPPGGGNERVATTIGPGKPQAVLATLLNGSKFNYVILGEPNGSGAVRKVILLAKSNAPAGGSSSIAQSPVRTPPAPQGVEPPDDEYPQNEPEVENQNPQQPGVDPSQQGVVDPGNRTPEEMLQELQRMQEQQQQMQQQLNPANRQPFGQPFNPSATQPSTPFPGQSQTPQPQ